MAERPTASTDADPLRLDVARRRVVVDTPSTRELRDLASLRRDFMLAASFVDFYLASEIESDGASPSSIDALWIAAVTTYGRAFSSGLRHTARAETSSLDSMSAREHEYFIDLRNKYIAHSVNGFEKTTVFADLTDPANEPAGVALVGEIHTSLSRLSRPRALELKNLCDYQVSGLTGRIDDLHQQVGNELAELGQEIAYGLPDFSPPRLDGTDPRSKRN